MPALQLQELRRRLCDQGRGDRWGIQAMRNLQAIGADI